MTANTNELDVKQFNDTPIIRRLKNNKEDEANKQTTTRGRKRKYNSPEERLEARRIQQKAYRERKRQQAQELKQTSEAKEDA